MCGALLDGRPEVKIIPMTHRQPLRILLCFLGCLLPRMVLATDYFITPAGDDDAAGSSPEAAWRTIARVNRGGFRPGDRILFQANQSFRGNLRLGQNSGGQTNAPVIISSFGGGQAKLLAGRETGITIESAGWITISNLTVLGDGATNNNGYGILFDNRLDEFRRLEHVRLEKVEVSGFGIFGVLISGKQAGFNHVRVVDCELHDNLQGGMEIAGRLPWDSPLYAHTDVEVTRCRAHHNSGDPNYDKNHSGSGMVLYEVDGGLIEECSAWANGQLCEHANGGVGIWSCACRGVVIQHCESYGNRTRGGDGGGFDLDGGSIDCVLQYNYSHDNDGPGLMVYTYAYASRADRGCIVRFNVSDNDSRRSRSYAGLWVRSDGNAITGLKVYNNTVRMGPWSNQAAYVHGNGIEAEFRNNLLIGCGGAAPLVVEQPQAKLRFVNNLYWAGDAPFKIQWGDQAYVDLAGWRQATGQETLDGKKLGVIADPQLPGESIRTRGGTGDWRQRLAAYKPLRESAILSQGIAVGPEVSEAEDCFDILGGVLTDKRWPLGAVGVGSL
jgi:hypothetical protein